MAIVMPLLLGLISASIGQASSVTFANGWTSITAQTFLFTKYVFAVRPAKNLANSTDVSNAVVSQEVLSINKDSEFHTGQKHSAAATLSVTDRGADDVDGVALGSDSTAAESSEAVQASDWGDEKVAKANTSVQKKFNVCNRCFKYSKDDEEGYGCFPVFKRGTSFLFYTDDHQFTNQVNNHKFTGNGAQYNELDSNGFNVDQVPCTKSRKIPIGQSDPCVPYCCVAAGWAENCAQVSITDRKKLKGDASVIDSGDADTSE